MRESLCTVDAETASAWCPEDERHVKRVIEQSIGFEKVNEKVQELPIEISKRRDDCRMTLLLLIHLLHLDPGTYYIYVIYYVMCYMCVLIWSIPFSSKGADDRLGGHDGEGLPGQPGGAGHKAAAAAARPHAALRALHGGDEQAEQPDGGLGGA